MKLDVKAIRANRRFGRYAAVFVSCILLLQFFGFPQKGYAKLISGVEISDMVVKQKVEEKIAANPVLVHAKDTTFPPMGIPRKSKSYDSDFLLCLALLICFGGIRQMHPIYVRNIFRAFRNPTLSNRQLKEQIRQDFLPGLLLDLLFCVSASLFLYHAVKYVHLDKWMDAFDSTAIIGMMAVGVGLVYIARFLLLKMAGWIFQIPDVTDNYAFNIFLFNRILGIILIPFTIVIAFGTGLWVQIAFLLALITTFVIYLFRFVRSRKVFSYFLQFSKFHFILYLCASEILPLAILIKIIGSKLVS